MSSMIEIKLSLVSEERIIHKNSREEKLNLMNWEDCQHFPAWKLEIFEILIFEVQDNDTCSEFQKADSDNRSRSRICT